MKKPDNTIVYTSLISYEIRNLYNKYCERKQRFGTSSTEAREAFLQFASACEKESRPVVKTARELSSN